MLNAVYTRLLVALLLPPLLACMPRVEPAGPEITAPRIEGETLVARDGARLPLQSWSANPQTRAVLVAIHGFNDYSNAFTGPAVQWRRQGIATYAYDQRGFGAAPGRGLWAGTETMAEDLVDMVTAVRAVHPGAPVYLLGESMGGAVTLLALARHPELEIGGAILSSPAVWGGKAMNRFYRAVLWLAAHTTPGSPLTGRGLGIRASDNDWVLQELGRDPLVIKETRVDAVYGLVGLMGAALEAGAQASTPFLLLYGANDQIIPEASTDALRARLPKTHRYVRYPDGWHMLLRDLQAQTVWSDIAAWIADREAPLPSGFGQERAADDRGD